MKKWFIIIALLIILLAIIGFGFYSFSGFGSSSSEELTTNNSVNESGIIDDSGNIIVGDLSYTLPEGYIQGETNSLGHISITNGSNKIFFGVFDDKGIDELEEEYVNYTVAHNQTANTNEFKENGINIISCVNNQVGAKHYWFDYNGKVYTIYTWAETQNDDEIFANLINSIH